MILDAYRRSDYCYRVDSEQPERYDGRDGFTAWVVLRRDQEHVTYWWCCRHRTTACDDVTAVRNLRVVLGLEQSFTSDEEG